MPKNPPIAHVYVFEATSGLVKIGHTTQPEQRLKKIQSASGFQIKRQFVSAPCYNYMEVEMNLQKEFAERRQQGEWFAIGFQTAVEALKRQRLETTTSSTQLVAFQFEQNEVRTFIDEKGDPWFVAKDVCEILDIQNASVERFSLDDDEIRKMYIPSLSNNYTVISESGLYTLIIRSNKPQAKPFRRWVTHEVIPTIRKTGRYEVAPPAPAQRPEYQDFGAFIAECFIPDPAGILASRDIYKVYKDWCKRYQRMAYTHKLLGQYLKESGYTHVRRTQRYCWLGLRLKMGKNFGEEMTHLQNCLSALCKIVEKEEEFQRVEVLSLLRLALEKSKELS